MTNTYTDECTSSKNKDILICIKDLAVAYQSNVALFDINLDVYKNDFFGICGPNGSGKSTLLKSIVGLVKPFRGNIRVFGKDVIKGHIGYLKSKIGYLPQTDQIDRNFPALVKDVVGMGLYSQVGFFKSLSKKEDEKIGNALQLVGMENMIQRPIGHLSGGQQQKVRIARALVNSPDILLIDEPFSALDFKIAKNIANLIAEIHEKTNLTIVLISHSLSLLKEHCNKVICLDKRIVWQGDPKSSEFDSAVKTAFL
ncbi:MAG: ABC transporter ATP-binding protein [Candidatus Heimdallarchaeota archaeon]|nr:ABC transporter ATP-binding protein [Candidatus Heimdallarchaeota archaeon]